MDNTPIFIKMADCPEIQEQREKTAPWDTWLIGDYYWANSSLGGCLSVHNDSSSYGLASSVIWLPRQDQLQKMFGEKSFVENEESYIEVLSFLDSFVFKAHSLIGFYGIYSMEQLWLAFVMSELHSKTWNGEAWVSA